MSVLYICSVFEEQFLSERVATIISVCTSKNSCAQHSEGCSDSIKKA